MTLVNELIPLGLMCDRGRHRHRDRVGCLDRRQRTHVVEVRVATFQQLTQTKDPRVAYVTRWRDKIEGAIASDDREAVSGRRRDVGVSRKIILIRVIVVVVVVLEFILLARVKLIFVLAPLEWRQTGVPSLSLLPTPLRSTRTPTTSHLAIIFGVDERIVDPTLEGLTRRLRREMGERNAAHGRRRWCG